MTSSNRSYTGNILLKTIEIEGTFDHTISSSNENSFVSRAKMKKKEEGEEDIMPLLFKRADPKRECLFEYIIHLEQLSEKNVIGQLEAIDSL